MIVASKETNSAKKPSIIRRILRSIAFGTYCLTIFIIGIFAFPFVRSKVIGKENVSKDDEAKVFLGNHYELFGPATCFLSLPYKTRVWALDKMMDPEQMEEQMGLMVYRDFKKVPKFIKKIVIKVVKNLLLTAIKLAGGIPVSRGYSMKNLVAMQQSVDTFEKGKSILIFPEKDYVKQGIGVIMDGFTFLGSYCHSKTGKKVSFYPMFISKKKRRICISKPIVYNPENSPTEEKERIVSYVIEEMTKSYEMLETPQT